MDSSAFHQAAQVIRLVFVVIIEKGDPFRIRMGNAPIQKACQSWVDRIAAT